MFKCLLDEPPTLTKRNLLSAIAIPFDPLGWLAPSIIQFKILMQRTWVRGLKWENLVPEDVQKTLTELRSDLPAIHDITIP